LHFIFQMEKKKKKKKWITKLKRRFKLAVINAETYKENWSVKINRIHLIIFFLVFIGTIVAITVVIIGYTPLNRYVHGYPSGTERELLVQNHEKISSLYEKMMQYEQWAGNINDILNGKIDLPNMKGNSDVVPVDSSDYSDLDFSLSPEESDMRNKIEVEDRTRLSVEDEIGYADDISHILFFPPIKGLITKKFDAANSHYGTDVVAAQTNVISAVLDGTVIMDTWTLETGYVIQIQHENNLISVYKHNAELLKTTGTHVKAGEAIAIFGNTGEYSSGPHLHFELWHNGTPVDPEKFILF